MSDEEIFKLNDEERPFDAAPGEKLKRLKPKDAATLILIRKGSEVMMGQRAKGHVFMPDKWVFPGGRVDPGDARLKAAAELTAETEALLRLGGAVKRAPRAFALAATRETQEETGMTVGGADGPDLSRLIYVARAVTPPHRTRRFDARFFMADAADVLASDKPQAGEELLHVEWFPIAEAEKLDLPSVTRFVLKEASRRLAGERLAPPFVRWRHGGHHLERLRLDSGG
ncbi:MAG: NUDIX hydrolase [Hyphomonadaceae bacterium]|nr:NUDIX hydrolase [Hyphomonadaceae bacterium]